MYSEEARSICQYGGTAMIPDMPEPKLPEARWHHEHLLQQAEQAEVHYQICLEEISRLQWLPAFPISPAMLLVILMTSPPGSHRRPIRSQKPPHLQAVVDGAAVVVVEVLALVLVLVQVVPAPVLAVVDKYHEYQEKEGFTAHQAGI